MTSRPTFSSACVEASRGQNSPVPINNWSTADFQSSTLVSLSILDGGTAELVTPIATVPDYFSTAQTNSAIVPTSVMSSTCEQAFIPVKRTVSAAVFRHQSSVSPMPIRTPSSVRYAQSNFAASPLRSSAFSASLRYLCLRSLSLTIDANSPRAKLWACREERARSWISRSPNPRLSCRIPRSESATCTSKSRTSNVLSSSIADFLASS